jgi:hypothetical protein
MSGRGSSSGRIIRAQSVPPVRRTCIVGGDSPEGNGTEVPTIVLEKDAAGNIARIVVHCPCGRHAELVCAYE